MATEVNAAEARRQLGARPPDFRLPASKLPSVEVSSYCSPLVAVVVVVVVVAVPPDSPVGRAELVSVAEVAAEDRLVRWVAPVVIGGVAV